MSQTEYDPQAAQDASPETGERHQIIVKEVPDSRSGLLVEVFHYREDINNCVRSASAVYIEDGYEKGPEASFLDGHTKDVFVDNTTELYASVRRDDNGYYVEIGERAGQNDREKTVLYATFYSDRSLALNELDFD